MKKKILVVDDSPVVLEAMKVLLEVAGYEVETLQQDSVSVDVAFKIVDLILMDVKMPGIYGDMMTRFMTDSNRKQSLICLFSGIPEDQLKARAEECGADGYICKEWEPKLQIQRIKELLGDVD